MHDADHRTRDPGHEPTHLPTHQSTHQPTHQPTHQSTHQLTHQLTHLQRTPLAKRTRYACRERRGQGGAASASRSILGALLAGVLVAGCARTGGLATSAPAASAPTSSVAPARAPAPAPASQNPSPMVESTRAHGRIAPHPLSTRAVLLSDLLPRPVELHLPARPAASGASPLLVHFLGPAYLAVDAAQAADSGMMVAVINLSPGSAAYERPFRDPTTWPRLIAAIDSVLRAATSPSAHTGDIYLSAFSAGNGAVRAILADSIQLQRIRGVAILDGIHTSYAPAGRVVAEGGTLDPTPLQAIARYARAAIAGHVRLLVTHSEVFPGTFASTTETADWLLATLASPRRAVLAWGPNGMQQTSAAGAGGFTLLGFAGNSAPDHLDHLHALREWLREHVAR
ncbi:MAG: hypothetical protein IT360_23390 [Gemmatimonadaceae bacterium]|nr:hypothetical protein [Gemmatimonadaceae bacterium]